MRRRLERRLLLRLYLCSVCFCACSMLVIADLSLLRPVVQRLLLHLQLDLPAIQLVFPVAQRQLLSL